jgi:hypothetical protein
MPHFSAIQQALNQALHQLLASTGCVSGCFYVGIKSSRFTLTGQHSTGKIIRFPVFDAAFTQLVNAYWNSTFGRNTAQLTIHIDVAQAQFRYGRLTTRQAAETKRAQPRSRRPYGLALAEQVAANLDQGHKLVSYHRDYCGQGLARHQEAYCYGPVWDGILGPSEVFADRKAFTNWLAAQSDFSLAGLENPDPWMWDNQTITRKRLLAFIHQT